MENPEPQTESLDVTPNIKPLGAWQVIRFSDRRRLAVADEELQIICEINAVREEHEANAKLIAAAPEMFKKLVEYAQAFPDEEALSLIAKAEGMPSPKSTSNNSQIGKDYPKESVTP